jgi:ADP-heptose:LPS heptosyltransferase
MCVKPRRILVVNLKFMGDLLIATALLRSLRAAHPDAHVTFLARRGYEDVLAGNPDIDEVIVFDRSRARNLRGLARYRFERDFVTRLRAGRFDTCLCMHPGDRLCVWAWLSGARWRIGPSRLPAGLLLNRSVAAPAPHLKGTDYLDYYYALAHPLGLATDRRTRYTISDESRNAARALCPTLFEPHRGPILGIHPGASAPARQWPLERFAELAGRLTAAAGLEPVVFSGPKDAAQGQTLFDGIRTGNKHLLQLPTLGTFAACLECCDLFVGNDSGPRHLAVAVGVPTITIMGQKDPAVWAIYPEAQRHWVARTPVSCQPCERIRCEKMTCMKAITVDQVFALAQTVLACGRGDQSLHFANS